MGINGIMKREEMVDVFGKGKFELLPFTKTKMKGNGEVSWCGVSIISVGTRELKG